MKIAKKSSTKKTVLAMLPAAIIAALYIFAKYLYIYLGIWN